MELRQLAIFLTVVQEGQLTRAASRLGLSPPAVTGHIQRLERELGARLLERSPFALTPAGERLVPHAQAMLATANTAYEVIADLNRESAAPLRVGVMAPGSANLTPAILRAFRKTQPGTPLSVVNLNFTDHTTALIEHQVDVAFVRPPPDDERIDVDVLTTEPRVLITSSAGLLADARSVHLADILDETYVGLPEQTPQVFADYLYFSRARNGIPPRCSPNQSMTLQDVLINVSAGEGTGAGLASFARLYHWPGIRFIPIVDAPWEQTVLATRHNDPRPQIRAFRGLATMIAKHLGRPKPERSVVDPRSAAG